MSKIRIIIHTLDIYNLQSRTASFPDHEKLLKKWIVFRIALFMNANTKNPHLEHCPCPKYGIIYKPGLYNLKARKKHLKNDQELKFILQNVPLLNNL